MYITAASRPQNHTSMFASTQNLGKVYCLVGEHIDSIGQSVQAASVQDSPITSELPFNHIRPVVAHEADTQNGNVCIRQRLLVAFLVHESKAKSPTRTGVANSGHLSWERADDQNPHRRYSRGHSCF